MALDRCAYVIGTDASADLVLGDTGIAERHMLLRLTKGQVAVEALEGDVSVFLRDAREMKIPAGKGHRARLPLDLRIGQARLTITHAAAPAEQATSLRSPFNWRHKPQWIIALVLMFFCVGAFALRNEPASVQRLHITDSAPESTREPEVTLAQSRIWLDQQLLVTRLNRVKVSEVDGQLSVAGTYDPARKSQWTALQQAFDGRFGRQVVLHSSVVAQAEVAKPRVRFQAVWFGADPYVINDSGKRLYPGAALADDWTLERIENNQVILARGEERFTFTL